MILEDVAEFLAALPPNRAICGLDLGDKTIGFAVSDLRRQVATPILVIRRTKFTEDAARLMALMAERQHRGHRPWPAAEHGRLRRPARANRPAPLPATW